jgi:hypothetical protein
MTALQRAAWDTFAATDPEPTFNSLGEPVTLSGWNYFVRCNNRLLQNGQAIIIAPPSGADATQPATITPTTFTVQTVTSPQIEIDYIFGGTPAGAYVVLFLTVLPTGGTVYNPNRLKWIASDTAHSSAWNPYAQFLAIFGQCPIGWGVAGRFYLQNASGLRSDPAELLTKIVN